MTLAEKSCRYDERTIEQHTPLIRLRLDYARTMTLGLLSGGLVPFNLFRRVARPWPAVRFAAMLPLTYEVSALRYRFTRCSCAMVPSLPQKVAPWSEFSAKRRS